MQRIALFLLILFALSGCKKAQQNYPSKKILILGNSVTYSAPNAALGWSGNWGMAATSADKDYVHLFTAELKRINNGTVVKIKNIARFEADFDTYNLDDNLKDEAAFAPDLLIIRIGENVLRTGEEELFNKKYQELINYFKAKNPSLKILAAGSVWPWRDFASNVMKKYSEFITLDYLYHDTSNYAFGLYADAGVATHPSDKGMLNISNFLTARSIDILYPTYFEK
jgi:hypothetical protein